MTDSTDTTPETETTPELDTSKTFEKAELNDLTVTSLKEICIVRRVSAAGKKAELVDRIMKSQGAITDRWVQGLTVCKVCRQKVTVRKTSKSPLSEGRTLITRNVRCTGRHRHRYPLKEVVTPTKVKRSPAD